MEKAKQMGIEDYVAELNEKVRLLEQLLGSYDDGRRKSFFCLAVSLLELQDVQSVVAQIESQTKSSDTIKDKAKIAAHLFKEMADKRNISLKLRK